MPTKGGVGDRVPCAPFLRAQQNKRRMHPEGCKGERKALARARRRGTLPPKLDFFRVFDYTGRYESR